MSNMEMVAASPRPNSSEHDSVEVEIDINRNSETLCIAKSPLLHFWNLLGFFRRVFLYFSITILADQGYIEIPKVFRVFLQCFPLISLAIYTFRQYNSLRVIWKNKYGLLIFVGLLFSMVGDMLLSFEDGSYLFVGIGSLIRGIAWTMYTFAFQWKPFASRLLARSLLAAILFYYYLYVGGAKNAGLTIQIGGGFYMAALFTVQWRGWARISYYDLVSSRWYEFVGALGTSFLVVSEGIYFVDVFLRRLPGAIYGVQSTYYVAQLFIALSVVDGSSIEWPQDNEKEQAKLTRLKRSFSNPKAACKEFLKRIMDWLFS